MRAKNKKYKVKGERITGNIKIKYFGRVGMRLRIWSSRRTPSVKRRGRKRSMNNRKEEGCGRGFLTAIEKDRDW